MEMTGEYRIAAPRARVWQALNDSEVLKASIPGCEELKKSGENSFTAKVRAKIGPVSARFNGEVTLSDITPPVSYTISGEGKGGAAGFAKGGAKVQLQEDNGGTLLRYEANGQVGGKLAQIGSRLVDGAARKLADEFFANFARQISGEAAPSAAAEEATKIAPEAIANRKSHEEHEEHHAPSPIEDPNVGAGARIGIWVTGVLVVVALLLLIFTLG